jgi:hypothetical protein
MKKRRRKNKIKSSAARFEIWEYLEKEWEISLCMYEYE